MKKYESKKKIKKRKPYSYIVDYLLEPNVNPASNWTNSHQRTMTDKWWVNSKQFWPISRIWVVLDIWVIVCCRIQFQLVMWSQPDLQWKGYHCESRIWLVMFKQLDVECTVSRLTIKNWGINLLIDFQGMDLYIVNLCSYCLYINITAVEWGCYIHDCSQVYSMSAYATITLVVEGLDAWLALISLSPSQQPFLCLCTNRPFLSSKLCTRQPMVPI